MLCTDTWFMWSHVLRTSSRDAAASPVDTLNFAASVS